MSILEELEAERSIRLLLAQYARYADDGDGQAFASLFTPDGVLTVMGERHVGSDAIATWLVSTWTGRPTKHLIVNQNIQVGSGSQASGTMDLVFLAKEDTDWRVLGTARYVDQFVKADDGWRISERSISPD